MPHITELRFRRINIVCMRLLAKPSGEPVRNEHFERDDREFLSMCDLIRYMGTPDHLLCLKGIRPLQ
jgi:hypothetical protein